MPRTPASWTTRLLILCLIGALSDATVFAAGQQPSSNQGVRNSSAASAPVFTAPPQLQSDHKFLADEFGSSEQRRRGADGYGRGGGRRNNAAAAEMVLGGIAAIAGTAILVYANRPDCSRDRFADGCGYGTKVVGGSFLAGGVVVFSVGALTWR
ncbi:MAG TPA: hypothetical protein VGJ29_04695 [Vicinamibacterales bacterium]